jgi:anti-sigma factor RsiW
MKFRNRRSELLTCKECIHLLLDYADGSMVPEVRLKLDEHLSACPPCQHYLRSYTSCTEMVQQLRDQEAQVPAELQDRLKSFLRKQVNLPWPQPRRRRAKWSKRF